MTAPTGQKIAEFSQRSARNARRRMLLWFILFVGSIVAMVVVANTNDTNTNSAVILVATVAIFLAIIGMILDLRKSFEGKIIEIYTDGFILHRENGNQMAAYLWKEVKECDLVSPQRGRYYGSGGGLAGIALSLAVDAMSSNAAANIRNNKQMRWFQLNIRGVDNKLYRLNQRFKNYIDMLLTMSKAMTDNLLPDAFNHLQNGRALQFGQISVVQTGLKRGNEEVPWNDISQVTLAGLTVGIKIRDPRNGKDKNWVRVGAALDRPIFVEVIRRFAPVAQIIQ